MALVNGTSNTQKAATVAQGFIALAFCLLLVALATYTMAYAIIEVL